jgi:hypothetical protein
MPAPANRPPKPRPTRMPAAPTGPVAMPVGA